jgi:uncharacterized protein DUF5916
MPFAILRLLLLQSVAADSTTLRHANGLVPPAVTAVRVSRPPVVDGRLDDSAWALATPVTQFLQTDPEEGKPVSESTEVRVVYDADAIYVGARLFDREPGRIVSRLGRRDAQPPSDDFRVLFDSYHDHRTAFRFTVNPAGVKGDIFFGDDGNYADDSWDPVWQVATTIDSLGWTAEMRIPFSQLRFSAAREQIWGVRFVRWIQRKNEFALFPFVGKTESGFVSRFAHLIGIHDIPQPRRLEVLPYTLARGTYDDPVVAGNPFDRGSRYLGGAGLDVKYGISSNLTLDAALNPDFGQVEIDPAFVNLTAFEQFLPEHRPFFIEGADIFTFGGNGGGFNSFGGTPQVFYSRRIGRPPQGDAYSPGQFVDLPDKTAILGAAKISGKTASGWSVGVLDALTAREFAGVADTLAGARYSDEVEPLANSFVGRLKHDYAGGNTTIGVLATAVNRDVRAPSLEFLRRSAYFGGVDLSHRWGHSTYTLAANVGWSYIGGDTTAIQQAQLSSTRYFQRPDATSFHYDPARTSLFGVTGEVYLNKVAGNWLWGLAGSTTTPGFEVNDIGFQRRVDRISAAATAGYHWTKPGKVFREASAFLFAGPSWNYDLDKIQASIGAFSFGTFHNFWFYNTDATFSARAIDDRLTRGGPLAASPAGWVTDASVGTDNRRPVSLTATVSYTTNEAGGWRLSASPAVEWRPSGAISLSLGPDYLAGRDAAQYVTQVSDTNATMTFGARYVFARLVQHSLDAALRVNLTFSPTLSFQLYAQPFVFTGDYQVFEELRAPRTYSFNVYGRDNGSTIRYDPAAQQYTVHPDAAFPNDSLQFGNPTFRDRSLRSNAVLRWEYRPGSTLFVVWTQSRFAEVVDPEFAPAHYLGHEMFRDRPTNVLLVKVNYWLSL